MRTKKVRFGILGCADIAKRKFIPALLKSEKAQLSAIASRDKNKSRNIAKKYDVQSYNYDELIQAPDLDAIYIPLPNIFHFEWTLKALKYGKHVLCEKPIVFNYASAKTLISRAKAKKRVLMEGYMFTFHPQHKLVKKIISDGVIGKIKVFRSSFGFLLKDKNNFRLKKGMGGDAIYEVGGYPVAAMRYFIDRPAKHISGYAHYDKIGIQRSFCALLSFSDGVSAYINGGYNQAYECYYQIIGEKASVSLDRCYTTPAEMKNVICIKKNDNIEQIHVRECDHFLRMINYFCEAVNSSQKKEKLYDEISKQAKIVELISSTLKER